VFGGAALLALLLAWLLHRSLFEARAWSFDTMLYARSWWGLAHGQPVNPIAGVHALSIHAHLWMAALAPLARWFNPASLLIAGNALAAFATFALLANALLGSRPAPGAERRAGWLAAGAVSAPLLAWASPWLYNPLQFDARPDVWAIPVMAWAALRWQRLGRLDAAGIAGWLAACLVREEVAGAVAAMALFAPTPWRAQGQARARLALAVVVCACWAAYLLAGRTWIGGDAAAARVSGTASEFLGAGLGAYLDAWLSLAHFKAEMVATLILSCGGLCLLGWRWLGGAAFGAAWLLASNRLAGDMLTFHYAMFAAPGIVAAAADGAGRLRARLDAGDPAAPRLLAAGLAIAIGVGALSSALPFGRRFDDATYALFGHRRDLAGHEAARALVSQVAADAPLAVHRYYGAPFAGRPVVHDIASLRRLVDEAPDEVRRLRFVAIGPGRRDLELGRRLVDDLGFRDAGHAGGLRLLGRR
jgi:hypothetical protein